MVVFSPTSDVGSRTHGDDTGLDVHLSRGDSEEGVEERAQRGAHHESISHIPKVLSTAASLVLFLASGRGASRCAPASEGVFNALDSGGVGKGPPSSSFFHALLWGTVHGLQGMCYK